MGTLSLVSRRNDPSTADKRMRSYLGFPLIDPVFSRHHDLTGMGMAQRQEWQIVQSQFDLQ